MINIYISVVFHANYLDTVYGTLMGVLNEYQVPVSKVIGICSDGASTMQGCHKGVCTQLARHIRGTREDAMAELRRLHPEGRAPDTFHPDKGVFVVHCVCYRLALILTDAIKGSKACDVVIPDQCVALLNGLYSYFAKSPKRKAFIRTFLLHRNRNPEAFGVVRPNPQEELDRVMAVLEEQHKLPN